MGKMIRGRGNFLGDQEQLANSKYGTPDVLFVKISIGGTLTPFAAPAVLMVN
jgi:hypothetical protein